MFSSWGLRHLLLPAVLLQTALVFVSALGTSCKAPLGSGTAAPSDPFWLETIKHQGISAFHPDPSSYQVFRNVKDFGAVGDGVTDDTAAINAAISAGGRCGDGCQSSTVTPAVIYFPQGTYLVSSPIIALYYSQLIGDAKNPPTILAAPTFDGFAVIDADPYSASGQYYGATNNFFRAIRNFVLDIRQVPATRATFTIHWRVAQATSLMNIVFEMSAAEATQHQGIWMEDGSGGFVGDLVFHGGEKDF
jgi:glucan 1,3-beta-glucosidase